MNKQQMTQNLQTVVDVVNSLQISASDAAKIVRVSQLVQVIAQELNSDNGQTMAPPPAVEDKPNGKAKAA